MTFVFPGGARCTGEPCQVVTDMRVSMSGAELRWFKGVSRHDSRILSGQA
jgi:hypothetical protein